MSVGKVYIGTSGWSYPHWGRGVFYPRSIPTQDWLKYYVSVFSSVEINATFYRLPNSTLLQKWLQITPPEFVFSVKIWRRISHELRLQNVRSAIQDFHTSITPLCDRIKVYLLQLPPSFIPTSALLQEFFREWLSVFNNVYLAVEFRNKKAFNDDIYEVLRQHNIALCLEDYEGSAIDNIITADWVYVRKHGPSGRYHGRYTTQQLKVEAQKISKWLRSGKDVYVFFNNDFDGYAPKNAQELMKILVSFE